MIYNLFKSLAFKIDPELIHELTIFSTSKFPQISSLFPKRSSKYDLSLKVGRNTWPFPIGLAAGLDKNGVSVPFFSDLGFGAVEVGTVTPRPQVGNDKPRLFRLTKEKSLRNRMGFNNEGSDFLHSTINSYSKIDLPIGVNIGKNKDTSNDNAYIDYKILFDKFKNHCDYLVINVSSPNTPGLRENQTKGSLEKILSSLEYDPSVVDLFVKIAPDIDERSLDDVINIAQKYQVTGIIGTNTTVMPEKGEGGISGRLLYERSKRIRDYLLEKTRERKIEVIGVGGFENYDQLTDYWKRGGRSIQIYTSFIYQGPKILNDLKSQIIADIEKKNLKSLKELIAFYARGKAS